MLQFYKRYSIVKCWWEYSSTGDNVYIGVLFDNKKQMSEKYSYTNHPDSVNFFHEKVMLMNREEDDYILYTTQVCEYAYDYVYDVPIIIDP